MDRKARTRLAILDVLKDASAPLSSQRIATGLAENGLKLSGRSVRLYLQELAEREYIEILGKRGSVITTAGREEIRAAGTYQRVGFLSAKIDQMTYAMTFDLATRSGKVIVNTSLIEAKLLARHQEEVCSVFAKGYAMGQLVGLLAPGEKMGALAVPKGHVGLCTVCAVTVNGVLLKHGVPMRSLFGGLLEMRQEGDFRFVEMIMYDGTSIDPLEVFIRGGLTDYLGAIKTGCGRIGVSFREIPANSVEQVTSLARKLDRIGLGAFLTIGDPGQALCDVPVNEGHAGAIVIGGLNAIAVIEESGHHVESRALSGLLEYHRLFHYSELPERLAELPS